MHGYAPVGLAVLFTLAVFSLGAGSRLAFRGIQERRAWRREQRHGNGRSRRRLLIAAAIGVCLITTAAAGIVALDPFGVRGQEGEQGGSSPPSTALPVRSDDGSVRSAAESERSVKSNRNGHKHALSPKDVHVSVLNAAGTTGLASNASSRLNGNGFSIEAVRDAPEPLEQSVVMYGSDARAEARLVGRKLGIAKLKPASEEVEAIAGGADVIVLLGDDREAAAGVPADTSG